MLVLDKVVKELTVIAKSTNTLLGQVNDNVATLATEMLKIGNRVKKLEEAREDDGK